MVRSACPGDPTKCRATARAADGQLRTFFVPCGMSGNEAHCEVRKDEWRHWKEFENLPEADKERLLRCDEAVRKIALLLAQRKELIKKLKFMKTTQLVNVKWKPEKHYQPHPEDIKREQEQADNLKFHKDYPMMLKRAEERRLFRLREEQRRKLK
jgi:hypothetical protein